MIKWIDLHNILSKMANDIHNHENNSQIWNQYVLIKNSETGDMSPCDTLLIDKNRMFLVINDE
jgi:hypothetical protein